MCIRDSPWAFGPNETRTTGAYYGYTGNTVTITCSRPGESASDSIVW